MATKKAGTSAKKTTRSKSQTTKTNVTTVKAVKTDTSDKATSKAAAASVSKFAKRNTALASGLIGEFIGVFALVSVYLATKGEPLYMGFTLVALTLMVGALSGAHLNPIVTVGAWVTRKVSHLKALTYIVAQVLGAGAAYVALSSFIGGFEVQGQAVNTLSQSGPEVFKLAALSEHAHWFVFFAELLGASIFAFAFAGTLREKADSTSRAFTIGLSFFVAVLIASVSVQYVSAQAVVNPVAALAAGAVDVNKIDWFAVAAYVVSPLIGGVVGFAVRDAVTVNEK